MRIICRPVAPVFALPSQAELRSGWGSVSRSTTGWSSDARTGSFCSGPNPVGLIALGAGERHRLAYPFFRVRGGLNHLLFRLSCFVA